MKPLRQGKGTAAPDETATAADPPGERPSPRSIDTTVVRALAEVLGSYNLTEIEVEQGDLRIRVTRQGVPAVQTLALPIPVAAAEPAVPAPAAENPGSVKSPMVGTVYLRPTPEAKPFVEVGSHIKAGDRVLLVEAMKTFNDILAHRSGVVAALLVEDGQPVEYGEPLLIIE